MIIVLLFSQFVLAQDSGGDHNHDHTYAEQVDHGHQVFIQKGCAACHGQNAQGTDIAPTLAGHTPYHVRRQVRAPIGIMATFGPDKITSQELDYLVTFITSLEGNAMNYPGIALGDLSFGYHWLLWLALQAEDAGSAYHYAAHAIALTQGVHQTTLEIVVRDLNNDDFATARTRLEPLLADVGVFSMDPAVVLLQMTYKAIIANDAEAALGLLQHYPRAMTTPEDYALAATIYQYLRAGAMADAAAALQTRLGDELYFEGDLAIPAEGG